MADLDGIAAGEHVHLHNIEYRELEREYEFSLDAQPENVLPEAEQATFRGYVRSGGTIGRLGDGCADGAHPKESGISVVREAAASQ